jgi:subtilisin family serine protease
MKNNLNLCVAIILVTITLASCSMNDANTPIASNSSNSIKNQYIVVLNDNTSNKSNTVQSASDQINKDIDKLLKSYNIASDNVVAVYDAVLYGFCATLSDEQVNTLKRDPRVNLIEKDQPVSLQGNIDFVENSKQNKILAQTTPWGITAVGGSVNATTSTGVAWIVDSGIDLDHSDLNVNASLGANFVTSGNDATTKDDLNGHGTHVAGIVAAKNNTIGSIGVCAGATVIPVKVFNYQGSGTMSQIISGLNFIKNNLVSGKINVVNLSLGGSGYTSLDNAVGNLANAGAYVVIAAGNNYKTAGNYSPARKNGTRIWTVSAYQSNGSFATYSNFNNTYVDYSAPGTSIYSTYKNNDYATMSGTSMACPYVAGILLANNGTINYSGNVSSDPDGTADRKAVR